MAQIFVYGESLRSCLVAIVVPDNDVLERWARENNIKGTIRDLCENTVSRLGGQKFGESLLMKTGFYFSESKRRLCETSSN